MSENVSEVAALKQRIAEEYEASQRALHDPAMVGRHAFMTAKTQRIGEHFQRLSGLVGGDQAMQIVAEVLVHAQEGGSSVTL